MLCRGDPLLILDWICLGRSRADQASRIAFSKMCRDFSVSEVFPFFGVSEMLPTMFRVEHRTLTADQTHGAVALHVFHCHLPILLARDLSPHFTSESLRLYVRTILRLFSARNKWREPSAASGELYGCKAINKTCATRRWRPGAHASDEILYCRGL